MKQSMHNALFSYGLVAVQFLTMAAILLLTDWVVIGVLGLLQLVGVCLAMWAVFTMHLGRFNIVPDPRPDSVLVQSGPYRWIRHPMYASILCVFLPMTVAQATVEVSAIFAVLALDLLIKLHYEEGLLQSKFDEYADYQRHTHRLIPYLY